MLAYLFYFPQWWSIKEIWAIIFLSNISSLWKVRFDPLSQHHCTHDLFSRTSLKLQIKKHNRFESSKNTFSVLLFNVCCSCVIGIIWQILYFITLLSRSFSICCMDQFIKMRDELIYILKDISSLAYIYDINQLSATV